MLCEFDKLFKSFNIYNIEGIIVFYYGFHARSTLARSIYNDENFKVKGINETNLKDWMLNNLQRII